MKLNQLRDNQGARSARKRIGRGIGSGVGKTSGAGHKGQKSRSGVSINGFEGGQMPIHRRLPKRGFNNVFRKKYVLVNLGRLQAAVDAKRLDASKTVDAATLKAAGLISKVRDGIRILGGGDVTVKLNIEAAGASASAVAAVEKAGGVLKVGQNAAKAASAKETGGKASSKSPTKETGAKDSDSKDGG